jgi:hypothetical protein
MPTEAYAHGGLCPMPSRTSYESSKGYIFYAISVGKQPGVVSLPGATTFNDWYKIEDCSKKVSTES